VKAQHGSWQSSEPVVIGRLLQRLKSEGFSDTAIDEGLREAYNELKKDELERLTAEWNAAVIPTLKAAMAGEYKVPPQEPFCEAWMAYALFLGKTHLSIREIADHADSINHAIPNPEEIIWAFVRMSDRGWLSEQGGLYGLTEEGRRTIEDIMDEGQMWGGLKRLESWLVENRPSRSA
jgi:DNA-binding PadR family transcriptional regulator